MAEFTARTIKVTYNGADVTKQFAQYAETLPPLRPTWEDAPELDALQPTFVEWLVTFDWTIRPRVAPRQSCLWRHSFDWRNRKRRHVGHRVGALK